MKKLNDGLVLANPGDSYSAYTYSYASPMGIKAIRAGTYELKWFDTVNGNMATQTGLSVSSRDVTRNKHRLRLETKSRSMLNVWALTKGSVKVGEFDQKKPAPCSADPRSLWVCGFSPPVAVRRRTSEMPR